MREAPELRFLHSTPGKAVGVSLPLVALGAAIGWAMIGRRAERPDRLAALGAAVGTSALAQGLLALARRRGWLHGGFFALPKPVQLALEVPGTIARATVWVNLYRTMARRSRFGRLGYAGLVAATVPLVMRIEPWEVRRGWLKHGRGFRTRHVAMTAVGLLSAAPLLYEGLRRVPPRGRVIERVATPASEPDRGRQVEEALERARAT